MRAKKKQNQLKKNNFDLINYVRSEQDEILERFDLTKFGLDDNQVESQAIKFGDNKLTPARFNIFITLMKAFLSPFNLILIAIDVFSFWQYFEPNSSQDPFDLTAALIVLTMILIAGTITFVQEYRSYLVIKKMITENKKTTNVIRNVEYNYNFIDNANSIKLIKEAILIDNDDLVPGDLVFLSNGDLITADLRVIWANNLYINQSSLTGESFPVQKKEIHDEYEVDDSHLDYDNICYKGTEVVSGSGLAVVVAAGQNTYFSLIDNKVKEEREDSSFEKGIKKITWYLIGFMLAAVPIVFSIYGLQKSNWTNGIIFTMAIAVGLTPEMLPIIVTSNLTRGYSAIQKEGVLVKNLNAVQNMGAIDILCTDKTGTITSGEITLHKVMAVDGTKSSRLEQALYLNSYFQSGFNNPIDEAVLTSGKIKKPHIEKFVKEWEIPFDFKRKMLSVILTTKNDKEIFTKGAVEEILEVCDRIFINGEIINLTKKHKEEIMIKTHKLNMDGFRVVGIAHNLLDDEDVEEELVFYGFATFYDEPKKTSKQLIKNLLDQGIQTKILTGDNEVITRSICKNVDFKITKLLSGQDIEEMDEWNLYRAVREANVFVKLSPLHKSTIIEALKEQGHVVGFMGDGINDAPVLRESDVAISFEDASNIAKDAADIILLNDSLMPIENAVTQGRKSLANMLKYIKVTVASNFGNVLSVMVALFITSIEPMQPIHLLLQNLLYDIVMFALIFDNVDEEFLEKPRPFTTKNIVWFALINGPVSSIFDISTFLVLVFGFQLVPPGNVSQGWLDQPKNIHAVAQFNASWFVVGLMTQTAVMQMYRTEKLPFIQSRASLWVNLSTIFVCMMAVIVPFTPGLNSTVQMHQPSWTFLPIAIGFVGAYLCLAQGIKMLYINGGFYWFGIKKMKFWDKKAYYTFKVPGFKEWL